MLDTAHELYLGWRRLCEHTEREACQDTHRCGQDRTHECLAGWRWDASGSQELGGTRGSAAVADGARTK